MTTKRFFRIQYIFAVMLALAIISSTFSWSPRPKVVGGGFMSIINTDSGHTLAGDTTLCKDKTYFTAMEFVTHLNGGSYYINGKSCSASTYKGTLDTATGKVIYDTSKALGAFSDTLDAGETIFFKTEITNTAAVKTNVSFFLKGRYRQNIQESINIGITSPVTKEGVLKPDNPHNDGTYINYKWYAVVSQYEIDESGTAYIEWYIRNWGNTAGLFEISSFTLTNN